MPVYRVCSGDLDVTIVRSSAQDAANDAIGSLKSGNFDKMKLGMMTSVAVMGGSELDTLFMETLQLVKRNGLTYKKGN